MRPVSRRTRLVIGWTAALLAAGLFAWLGLWQGGRAVEKERMLDEVAGVLAQRRPVPLAAAHDRSRSQSYDWTAGRGRFAGEVLWLDNQQRDGRVGLRAYAPFRPRAGDPLLVDMGWAPGAPDRRRLPRLQLPTGEVELRGLLAPPPSHGLDLGAPMARQADGWLMLRVDPAAITVALASPRPFAPRVLRLDPALGYGLPRDLRLLANTLPPEKHRGYALQWFGLAATLLVIALVLTFRKPRR